MELRFSASQYPVYAPLSSTHRSRRRKNESTRRLMYAVDIVAHFWEMLSQSLLRASAFAERSCRHTRFTNFFETAQPFSIGLRSGERGGQVPLS